MYGCSIPGDGPLVYGSTLGCFAGVRQGRELWISGSPFLLSLGLGLAENLAILVADRGGFIQSSGTRHQTDTTAQLCTALQGVKNGITVFSALLPKDFQRTPKGSQGIGKVVYNHGHMTVTGLV